MKHFINIIFNKIEEDIDMITAESLLEVTGHDESDVEIYNTDKEQTVLTMELNEALTEDQSNDIAQKIADYVFEMGYDNFDIEISV